MKYAGPVRATGDNCYLLEILVTVWFLTSRVPTQIRWCVCEIRWILGAGEGGPTGAAGLPQPVT